MRGITTPCFSGQAVFQWFSDVFSLAGLSPGMVMMPLRSWMLLQLVTRSEHRELESAGERVRHHRLVCNYFLASTAIAVGSSSRTTLNLRTAVSSIAALGRYIEKVTISPCSGLEAGRAGFGLASNDANCSFTR